MLFLHLDEERTAKFTRDREGALVMLSVDSCTFIFEYCMFCMNPAVAKVALHRKTPAFLEEDWEDAEDIDDDDDEEEEEDE